MIEGQGYESELLRESGNPIWRHHTEPLPNLRRKPAPRDPETARVNRLLYSEELSRRCCASVRRKLETQGSACLMPAFVLPCWKSVGQWWGARGVRF